MKLNCFYMTVTLTFRNDEKKQNFNVYILEDESIKQDYVRTINGVKAPSAMRKRKNPEEFEIGGNTMAADLKLMEDLTQHFKSIFYIDAYNVTYCFLFDISL
ncbi:hypothetical protein GCK72_022452 [Caenorhabditis remanei]|nr:hypothetical protein GCK72_022452 [Caenorhabditis remanei]KAF1746001.1 hypothetical protein GCK72_022452 [Caenorhabditis remanei]